MIPTTLCPTCSTPFRPRGVEHLYCSKKCRPPKSLKPCEFCGEPFRPRNAEHIYCDRTCERRAAVPSDRRCEWCGTRLISLNPKARFCCSSHRIAAFKARPCGYCKDSAGYTDHFVPFRVTERMAELRWTLKVPICDECNKVAGGRIFPTMKAKRTFIKVKYLDRYKKLLDDPDWSEDELAALGYSLQSHMRRYSEAKSIMRSRLASLDR